MIEVPLPGAVRYCPACRESDDSGFWTADCERMSTTVPWVITDPANDERPPATTRDEGARE